MGSYLKSSSGEAKYLRVVEMTLSSDYHEEKEQQWSGASQSQEEKLNVLKIVEL